jgi:hypothetical protein
MIARFSLAALAAFALSAQAQTPAATPGGSSTLTVPPHSCVQPKIPTEHETTRLRGDAYNKAIEAFNKEYRAYGECIKKYVDETRAWGKEIADAGNKAVDEYNKFTADLREKLEADKK